MSKLASGARSSYEAPEIEVTPSMLDAAMTRLQETDLAWDYVDRDLMREILRCALSKVGGRA